jgi:hypothetical protein
LHRNNRLRFFANVGLLCRRLGVWESGRGNRRGLFNRDRGCDRHRHLNYGRGYDRGSLLNGRRERLGSRSSLNDPCPGRLNGQPFTHGNRGYFNLFRQGGLGSNLFDRGRRRGCGGLGFGLNRLGTSADQSGLHANFFLGNLFGGCLRRGGQCLDIRILDNRHMVCDRHA